jgi:hypothetical protein
MTEVILKIEFGGLGDHLFHTPLPRLLKEYGLAKKVYLSYNSAVRNEESLDFVWGTNPYLDGFSSFPATKFEPIKTNDITLMNIIAAHHGIPELGMELFPEIHKELAVSTQFSANSYIDLNYTSFIGALTPLDKLRIYNLYHNHLIVNPSQMVRTILPFRKFIYTSSLIEYATLIKSCKDFVCLASGGATLASALKKHATVYFGHGFPETIKHTTNSYIQHGSSSFIRHQLARLLFKKNQIRLKFSKNK